MCRSTLNRLRCLWRFYNIIISICLIIIGSIFGPVANLAYAAAGPTGEIAILCKLEAEYCALMTYVNYIMWILFLTSIMLMLGCCFECLCLVHCCIGLYVVIVVASICIFSRYVYHCTLYDRVCLDHSKDREGDDVAMVIHLFFINLIFVAVITLCLYVLNQYRKVLEFDDRLYVFVLFVLITGLPLFEIMNQFFCKLMVEFGANTS